jgi:hypothetical protein
MADAVEENIQGRGYRAKDSAPCLLRRSGATLRLLLRDCRLRWTVISTPFGELRTESTRCWPSRKGRGLGGCSSPQNKGSHPSSRRLPSRPAAKSSAPRSSPGGCETALLTSAYTASTGPGQEREVLYLSKGPWRGRKFREESERDFSRNR